MKRLLPFAYAISTLLLLPGCANSTQCGEGTEAKFDSNLGATVCTGKIPQQYVQCDPKTAVVQGGICVADPSKAVKCGDGTMLDTGSNTCVPVANNCGPQPKPCPPQQGDFAIKGVITHLKDGTYATGESVEVRAYNPFAFLLNPTGTTPLAKQVTTDSTYCFDNLTDTSGQGIIAIAVTDPNGPTNWVLAGVGQDNLTAGQTYRTDGFIIEKSLVAAWDMQAGLAAGSFENSGAYVAKFLDKPAAMDSTANPVSGVVLQQQGMDATQTFYFSGSFTMIDKTLMATDGQVGAAVQEYPGGAIGQYSGKGGMVNGMPVTWEAFPGASTAGVVFVQKFHPM